MHFSIQANPRSYCVKQRDVRANILKKKFSETGIKKNLIFKTSKHICLLLVATFFNVDIPMITSIVQLFLDRTIFSRIMKQYHYQFPSSSDTLITSLRLFFLLHISNSTWNKFTIYVLFWKGCLNLCLSFFYIIVFFVFYIKYVFVFSTNILVFFFSRNFVCL